MQSTDKESKEEILEAEKVMNPSRKDKQTQVNMMDDQTFRDKLYIIRGQKVMLDLDLAEIYGIETKILNRQVIRNIERFSNEFMFQLDLAEIAESMRCQSCTSWKNG